jgi:hypothetical protein
MSRRDKPGLLQTLRSIWKAREKLSREEIERHGEELQRRGGRAKGKKTEGQAARVTVGHH